MADSATRGSRSDIDKRRGNARGDSIVKMQRRQFSSALSVTGLGVLGGLGSLASGMAQAQGTASGVELSGVRYAPTVSVGGSNLVLNGAGIRYRFVVKVYTAGLYLTARANTPQAVLATPGPKRLHVVMLRDIDATELGRLFTKGMQDNASREDFAKSIAGTVRMGEIFQAKKRLAPNENFSVDFVPGVGTTVLINGRAAADPIKEPEFFSSLMRIWLGDKPADALLKDALLGLPPR